MYVIFNDYGISLNYRYIALALECGIDVCVLSGCQHGTCFTMVILSNFRCDILAKAFGRTADFPTPQPLFFFLEWYLTGRSSRRFSWEVREKKRKGRKVGHGFSSRFARQKNLLSTGKRHRKKGRFLRGGRYIERNGRVPSNDEKTLLYVKTDSGKAQQPNWSHLLLLAVLFLRKILS